MTAKQIHINNEVYVKVAANIGTVFERLVSSVYKLNDRNVYEYIELTVKDSVRVTFHDGMQIGINIS